MQAVSVDITSKVESAASLNRALNEPALLSKALDNIYMPICSRPAQAYSCNMAQLGRDPSTRCLSTYIYVLIDLCRLSSTSTSSCFNEWA